MNFSTLKIKYFLKRNDCELEGANSYLQEYTPCQRATPSNEANANPCKLIYHNFQKKAGAFVRAAAFIKIYTVAEIVFIFSFSFRCSNFFPKSKRNQY